MMYLLADPGIIYLDLPDPPQDSVEKLVNRILRWNRLWNEYEIEIVMTERCRDAITDIIDDTYTIDMLQSVFESMGHDIMNAISPLLESLLAAKQLDPLLVGVNDRVFDTESFLEKMVIPEYFGNKQKSKALRHAFYDMLWRVVAARKHLDNPPAELEKTAVLTSLDGRQDLYDDYLSNLFVIVGKDEQEKTIVENLPVIDIDEKRDALEHLINDYHSIQDGTYKPGQDVGAGTKEVLELHTRLNIKSLLHAVEKAVTESAGALVLPVQSRRNVKQAVHFDDNLKIYRLLRGLEEVWLEAYIKFGQDRANFAFKRMFGHEVASNYGESTIQNPDYVRRLEVQHKGKLITCKRHVKLSDSSGKFRINFQEQEQEDGSYRLILGLVGRHIPTSRFDG